MKITKKLQVQYTIAVSILAYLLPFILYQVTDTVERSISAYHETDASIVLLIMLLLVASSFFTGLLRYKIGGILLILVAIINIDYGLIHDIVAYTFFLYIATVIFIDKRFYLLSIPMILSLFFINKLGMYAYEVIAIFCIASFSMLYGLRYLKILNTK